MKFARAVPTFRTVNTSEQPDVDPVVTKLAQYKQKWLNHVSRLENIRYTK